MAYAFARICKMVRLTSFFHKLVIIMMFAACCFVLSACSGDLIAGWSLSDGSGTLASSEVEDVPDGEIKWGVWLNSRTFGRVLDFSTSGSNVFIEKCGKSLGSSFTVSAWVMAPEREDDDRVIIAQDSASGGMKLFLDGSKEHELSFEAEGITGTESSGVSLADGRWHHIAVSVGDGSLIYYIDGNETKRVGISGSIPNGEYSLYVGSDPDGSCGFDGSVAQVRIFEGAVAPDKTTESVLDSIDNEPAPPRMDLKRGIVIDRRQYYGPVPDPSEGQTVTEDDIINCRNMGFDHVKILLTPNHLIADDGSLKRENMEYITQVINYVRDNDFRCILCIHPEGDFKMIYLKNLDNFETLLKWYGELASYIGEHWDADTVAIQLMTEPGNNNMTVSWSWMSDRMWGAVRNVLPDHTILTSSDRYGNIEQLKYMSPATDSNLIYTFTTYEPYTIGWYYYGTTYGVKDAWSYVHDIPYPVKEGEDYTDEIEYAISDVPESLREGIRKELWAYVRGEYDGRRTDMINNYDCLYNARWHMLRAESLDAWRQKYGGNIHIMCVEFGCMDAKTPQVLWDSAAPCYGISDEKRIEFVRDVVASFDAYDIGFSYWSYNEAHTIFDTGAHSYGASPNPKVARNMFDYEMLTKALKVTPLVSADPDAAPEEFDPSWTVINSFESVGNWSGSGPQVSYNNPPTGFACVMSDKSEPDGATVFMVSYASPKDLSAYADGYAHLWVYVEDASKLVGGQIELCSGGGPDMYETSWNIVPYISASGWNELYLPLKDAGTGNKPADLAAINYIRIFFLQTEKSRVGLDCFYMCNEAPQGANGSYKPDPSLSEFVISEIEELSPWYGTGHELVNEGAAVGSSFIAATSRDGAGSAVFAASFAKMDLSDYSDGNLHMWIYVDDISKLVGGQLELTSSGGPDNQESSWEIRRYIKSDGWNEVVLPFSEASSVAGGADLTSVDYVRLYLVLTADVRSGIDQLSVVR